MADGSVHIMDFEDQTLLDRFAEYVRPYPAKVLAQAIKCDERTAKHFRAGTSWPTHRHWREIIRAFGRDVIAAVFEPEINDTLARLDREAVQLEERLALVRARRRQAVGGLEGDEDSGFAADPRRAATVLIDGEEAWP